jgi:DNA repair exonuclease SbcCD nuclease subunit
MDSILKNPKTQYDFIDYILIAGDNLYPTNDSDPKDWEFEEMLNLFKNQPNINKLPVFPVRGNHDSGFDWQRELKLS